MPWTEVLHVSASGASVPSPHSNSFPLKNWEVCKYKVFFTDNNLVIKVSNGNNENGDESSKKVSRKRKHQEIIDKEHFIPYKPKNFNQEKA